MLQLAELGVVLNKMPICYIKMHDMCRQADVKNQFRLLHRMKQKTDEKQL